MRRKISLLLSLVLVSACGGDGGQDAPGEDTVALIDIIRTNDVPDDIPGELGTDTDIEIPAPECKGGMCLVPAGTFTMGCNEAVDSQCYHDELPPHEVTLDAFEITETEISVALYRTCFDAGACPTPSGADVCNWNHDDRSDHPMNCCMWQMADAYCAWAGMRLCTEAEWEKAARGDDGRKYPWGNEALSCELAHFNDGENGCGTDRSLPVGSFPAGASPFGVLDMSGNVWEWVGDWYGSEYYDESPAANPLGPDTGAERVRRGGAYTSEAFYQRSSFRFDYTIEYNMNIPSVGIRCCRQPNGE
jgi:formylglycine-generating enzyme required for sulfatase activity